MPQLVKLELLGAFLGEQDNNIFHYFMETVYDPAFLAGMFVNGIVNPLRAIKHVGYEAQRVRISNITNPSDPVEEVSLTDFVGVRVGTASPSFCQWSFIMQTYGRIVKAGGKRFGGVNESDTTGNDAAGFFLDNLANLESPLSAVYQKSDGSHVLPMIYRRESTVGANDGVAAQVSGAAYSKLSTMDTRKAGRGAPAVGAFVPTLSYTEASFTPPAGGVEMRFSDWLSGGGQPFYLSDVGGNGLTVNLL